MPLNIYIYIHSDNRDHHVVCGQLCALGCEITMWDHHVSYHDSDDYEYVRRVHMTTTMIIIIIMIMIIMMMMMLMMLMLMMIALITVNNHDDHDSSEITMIMMTIKLFWWSFAQKNNSYMGERLHVCLCPLVI